MDAKTINELKELAKEVLEGLKPDEEIVIDIGSDDKVHLGPPSIHITISKRKSQQ